MTEIPAAVTGDGTLECDVAGAPADLATVAALARLRLTARRHGHRLVIRNAGPDLRDLIVLLGLREPLGQPEEREQPGGVEEVVDRRDPAVLDPQDDQ
ncbi:MAG TPA: STAS domain-containing protein [Actinoplanes sp.]|nr:STAS domain-containing protein [Actinoplanes sp.]